jgi:hypothetical protein
MLNARSHIVMQSGNKVDPQKLFQAAVAQMERRRSLQLASSLANLLGRQVAINDCKLRQAHNCGSRGKRNHYLTRSPAVSR